MGGWRRLGGWRLDWRLGAAGMDGLREELAALAFGGHMVIFG